MATDRFDELLREKAIFLNFFKSRFPVYHNSNIFFRDMQYSIKRFFETKNIKTKYADAEAMAKKFTTALEQEGVLVKVSPIAWKLNYPQFQTGAPQTYEVTQQ